MYNQYQNDTKNKPASIKRLTEFKTLEELPETKPLALIGANQVIYYANSAFKKIFSISEGNSFDNLKTEPYLPYFIDGIIKSKYKSFTFELFLLTDAEKEPVSFNVDIERILLEEGEFLVFHAMASEERKKFESRINNLHNALEYGNIPVIITDEEGIINYSTQSFENILNLKIESFYGKFLPDLLLDFMTNTDIQSLRRAIQKKEPWKKLISDIGEEGHLWFREVRLNPVRITRTEPVSFILTANDITDYIQKNRIIKKSEQRQKSIINNISDLLLIVRKEKDKLIFDSGNDNFYDIFDICREESSDKELISVIPEDLFLELKKAVNRINDVPEAMYQFRYSERRQRKEYLGKITYTDDLYANERLFIISLADITEQLMNEDRLKKALRKEAELNRLKSTFLANMSHEIRTPLNAVVGYSDLIEEELAAESYDDIIELTTYMKEGVTRLLQLVDNIVEVSMIESGAINLDIMIMNANTLIKGVYQDYYLQALSRSIKFEILLDPKEAYFEVDEQKFRKIMSLLLDNAIKFNKPDGEINIRSKISGDFITIEIQDTGIGIEEDKIEKVLEPFRQVEEEGHKRNYEGAGLGLTIAYKLTRLLNGSFNIRSKPGVGTQVFISFPIVRS